MTEIVSLIIVAVIVFLFLAAIDNINDTLEKINETLESLASSVHDIRQVLAPTETDKLIALMRRQHQPNHEATTDEGDTTDE